MEMLYREVLGDPPSVLKVVFIGNAGVGSKTSLIKAFGQKEFTEDTPKTIGIDVTVKRMSIEYTEMNYEAAFLAFLSGFALHPECSGTTVPRKLPLPVLKKIHSEIWKSKRCSRPSHSFSPHYFSCSSPTHS